MSYDVYVRDPKTGETAVLDEAHDLKGGTYVMGGTRDAWLNITYNYWPHFRETLGEKGIRSLYGKTGREAAPLLREAVARLGTERADDYWEPTPGNAGSALADLLTLAELFPDGVIEGD